MTTEELLLDRYKVIADFPGCSYEVGTVLYVDPSGELYSPIAGYSRTVTKVMQCDVDKYPAYIQPLPWFKERQPGDMPEFVKHVNGGVFKVVEHCVGGASLEGKYYAVYKNLQPATIADYEAYQQSKNK